MIRVGLVGENISHSRSPQIVEQIFCDLGIDGQYKILPTSTEDLPNRLNQLRSDSFAGVNVTSPHKQVVLPLVDELTSVAVRLGAVNAIRFDPHSTVGTNTDVEGFDASLPNHKLFDRPFCATILGTGGAARAAVEVLLRMTNLESLFLLSRSIDRAVGVTRIWNDNRLKPVEDSRALGFVSPAIGEATRADLVVNATPVGMYNNEGSLLVAAELAECKLLYDMIYLPSPTELMKQASIAGAEVVGGDRMLLEQAKASVRFWLDSPQSSC